VPPAKAAEIAADKGIKVYTVAVGDPQAAGEDALDIGTLKHVAETTGGLYSFAADRRQLDEIYHHLDQIEVHQAQTISHRPRRDIFYWPLGIALLASFVQHGLQFLLARPRTAKTSSGAPPLRTQKVAT
jgi:Ca-activated chloride channel homolog